jgi:hypothetical protein
MVYRDAREPDAYLKLPKIAANDLKILWCTEWYDGPEAGVLWYHNRRCYFATCRLLDDDTKIVLVVALTEEQLGELEYRVTKWVEKVGGKSPHVYIDIPVEKPGDPRLFMDYHTEMEKRPKPDYSQNQVLGWFEFLRSSELCFGMGVEKSNKS